MVARFCCRVGDHGKRVRFDPESDGEITEGFQVREENDAEIKKRRSGCSVGKRECGEALMHSLLMTLAQLWGFAGKEVGRFERNLNIWLKPNASPVPPPR